MVEARRIRITGIVQGVGFRPFVYCLAKELSIKGMVYNDGLGVVIHGEGSTPNLDVFEGRLHTDLPPLAKIDQLSMERVEVSGYEDFTITESKGQEGKFVLVSPDVATCPQCLEELLDPQDPRSGYPFINCTNCGPRFTIIKDIPYDRKFTTMEGFPMCTQCNLEYHQPTNRRFHAQPNACPQCGPGLALWDKKGQTIMKSTAGSNQDGEIIKKVSELLDQGYILAIKGLGGYHLACDATNQEGVGNLRKRKIREDKPFAVMMADTSTVRKYCALSNKEEELLTNRRRPIVLLKKEGEQLAPSVAPGNDYLGVMLPYTPLHHLLVGGERVLVMTSGNLSSEPIVYKDEEVLERLAGIADFFLVHNREIHRRVDDSVTRVFQGEEYILRRSRGYVPEPLQVKWDLGQLLACGAEQKNVFALTRGNQVFMSHHIGDLENLETLQSFEEGVEHFQKLFNTKAELLVHDLHPEYLSTKWALEQDLPKLGVQHHHAHIAGVMAEHNLDEPIMGIAFDGTGYGLDGNLWGGEFFVGDYGGFQRVAHLKYSPLPGGAAAIKEPWRMGCMYLQEAIGSEFQELNLKLVKDLDLNKWKLLRQAVEKGINSPLSSSMGRLFDGVAAILGVRSKVNYEGQGAIELEQLAVKAPREDLQGESRFDIIEVNQCWEIDYRPLIKWLLQGQAAGVDKRLMARRFHTQVALMMVQIAQKCRRAYGTNKVALSGGVFQNILLLSEGMRCLEKSGFQVYMHHRVPANDGGIALGQALLAKGLL